MKSAKLKILPVIRDGVAMIKVTGWSDVADRDCLMSTYNPTTGPAMFDARGELVVYFHNGKMRVIRKGDVFTIKEMDTIIKTMKAAGNRMHNAIQSKKKHVHTFSLPEITPKRNDETVFLLEDVIRDIRSGKRYVVSTSITDDTRRMTISVSTIVSDMCESSHGCGLDGSLFPDDVDASSSDKMFKMLYDVAEDLPAKKRKWDNGKERTIRI